MTKVLSLDTSSSATGWALFVDGEYARSGCIDLKSEKDAATRLKKMVELLFATLRSVKPDLVYLETPVVLRNAQAQRTLSMIMGFVYGYCVLNNIYFEDVRPTVWRKYACVDGEKPPKKRSELKIWSVQKVKEIFEKDVSDDESDAILLGWSQMNRYGEKGD